ncbi:MAG TPA: hypothetical protein VFW50_15865 [Streptosporangiaceae bacterium]|nr:hypothetical protein [Streptosporangiaceae bacterium]
MTASCPVAALHAGLRWFEAAGVVVERAGAAAGLLLVLASAKYTSRCMSACTKLTSAVRTLPHEPELTRLVQRGDGVLGITLHHVGNGGEFVRGVQDHRRCPQEVAGHLVGAGEPAPQDRIRAWQDDVVGQR